MDENRIGKTDGASVPFVSDRTDSDGAISVNVAFDGFNDNFSIVFGSDVTVGSIVDKQGTAFTDYELNDKVLKFNNPTQGNEYTIAATVAGYSYTVKVTPEYEFMPDYVTIIKSPSRNKRLFRSALRRDFRSCRVLFTG